MVGLLVGFVAISARAEAARILEDEEGSLSFVEAARPRSISGGFRGEGVMPEEPQEAASALGMASGQVAASAYGRGAIGSGPSSSRFRRDSVKDALREEGEKLRWRRAPRFKHGIKD